MNIDNERAEFEKWAEVNATYLNLRRPKHDERGFYWQETETQFTAFKAGWLASAQSDKAVSVGSLEDQSVWIGSRFLHLLELSKRVPGWTGCDVDEGCCSDQDFNDAIEVVCRAIGDSVIRALIAKETGNG